MASLKRLKDDVKEVQTAMNAAYWSRTLMISKCDIIENYIIESIASKL